MILEPQGYDRTNRSSGRWIVLAVSCAGLLASYVNLRFIGIPGNPFVLISAVLGAAFLMLFSRYVIWSSRDALSLIAVALSLTIFGLIDYHRHGGIDLNASAVAAGAVLLGAYITARVMLALRVAYYFSAFAFLIVIVPSASELILGGNRVLASFFAYSSENYLTSWLIVTSLAMTAASVAERRPIHVLPALATFLVAFSQYTRASIAVALVGLLFVSVLRFGAKRTLIYALVCILMAFPFAGRIYDHLADSYNATKFAQHGFDSPRWEMLRAYSRMQDIGSLVFGMDPANVPIIAAFNGNPHNSVVRFHAYFGIVPLLAIATAVVRKLPKRGIVYAVPMILIVVRGFTDIILIGTVLDVFLMISAVSWLGTNSPPPLRWSSPTRGVMGRAFETDKQ